MLRARYLFFQICWHTKPFVKKGPASCGWLDTAAFCALMLVKRGGICSGRTYQLLKPIAGQPKQSRSQGMMLPTSRQLKNGCLRLVRMTNLDMTDGTAKIMYLAEPYAAVHLGSEIEPTLQTFVHHSRKNFFRISDVSPELMRCSPAAKWLVFKRGQSPLCCSRGSKCRRSQSSEQSRPLQSMPNRK